MNIIFYYVSIHELAGFNLNWLPKKATSLCSSVRLIYLINLFILVQKELPVLVIWQLPCLCERRLKILHKMQIWSHRLLINWRADLDSCCQIWAPVDYSVVCWADTGLLVFFMLDKVKRNSGTVGHMTSSKHQQQTYCLFRDYAWI